MLANVLQISQGQKTYPITTDSDVEDNEERAVTKSRPGFSISNLSTGYPMEDPTIAVPSDGLRPVVAVPTIELNSPRVVVAIGQFDVAGDTTWLVANATRRPVTMSSTITDAFAVDVLHDIELSTGRPFNALANGSAEEPEGRPDALLAPRRVTAQTEFRLNPGNFADLWGKCILALNTRRCPSPIRPQRDHLKRALTTLSKVACALDVGLDFVVEVLLLLDNVPCVRVGQGAGVTVEVLVPDTSKAAVRGRLQCCCNGEKTSKDSEDPRRKHDDYGGGNDDDLK